MPIKYEEKKDNEFDQILEENIVLPRDSYIHIYMFYTATQMHKHNI